MSKKWMEQAVQSIITRRPQINPKGKWEYEDGLVLDAIYTYYKATNNPEFLTYIQNNLNFFINAQGEIARYSLEEFNIDNVNNGKILTSLYLETKEEKYKIAIDTLREQLNQHPRTTEGAFWHKKIYPYQIWLDGLYMGSVFYARYIQNFAATKDYSDVTKQFIISYKHTLDEKTGLLYHAWDERKEQEWANPETGLSPHFWGRAMGWYVMALIDVIEVLPKTDKDYPTLTTMLTSLLEALKNCRDSKTKLWYQILDLPKRKGNYLESSASSMIVAAFAKAYRLGLAGNEYKKMALESYEHIIEEFITETKEGYVNVNKMCGVAGLGGADRRDGTFAYYISEAIVANDHKGYGAFLHASVQVELIDKLLD
jgi:Predicted unsaturated glucuronyl hydrolase involved in regulation of bacterial surface properties, and related proteins